MLREGILNPQVLCLLARVRHAITVVPVALGWIRSGDTTQYGNIILEST